MNKVNGRGALRLGTRGSQLALVQSRWVASQVEVATGRRVELQIIKTEGDLRLDQPLSRLGGKGLFTRELDRALLNGEVDFAVHSLKDLPTTPVPGLAVAATPEREDPRDVLVGPDGTSPTLRTLPDGARVGTSSLRRQALCRAFRKDLNVESIRGNLDTRMAKTDAGEFDAILLAGAGIRRLGHANRIGEWMERTAWLPAPGQGALGIVSRDDDPEVQEVLGFLDHTPTRAAVEAERGLLHTLEGGCQVPVGALGIPFQGRMKLFGVVASPDGKRVVRGDLLGRMDDPKGLGRELAELLLERGAGSILDEVRASLAADALSEGVSHHFGSQP